MNFPELARAVERLETRHMTLYAAGGGEVFEAGGVRAVYCGDGVPVNVGIGFGDAAQSAARLPEVEAFLQARGAAPAVVAYAHLSPQLLSVLGERNYRLSRILHVHARELKGEIRAPALPARQADSDEWLACAVASFGEENRRIMALTATRPQTTRWVCEQGGELLGVAALTVAGGLALLFSAGTRQGTRGRGAQTALLAARLEYAREQGATFAAVMTVPGSSSERNALRASFWPLCARLSFARQFIPA